MIIVIISGSGDGVGDAVGEGGGDGVGDGVSDGGCEVAIPAPVENKIIEQYIV